MSLVTGQISNLFNGISQQAPALRLPTQGEESTNFYPALVDGLVKRPPTRHICKVDNNAIDAKMHLINRDPNNRYIAIFGSGGSIKVYDLQGNAKSVTIKSTGTSYLSYATPKRIGALSVADYTFIFNKDKSVSIEPAGASNAVYGVVVYIKQASYDTKYTLKLSSQTMEYNTPPNVGTVENPPPKISTQDIAESFKTQIGYDANSAYKAIVVGSSLFITRKSGGTVPIECSVSDSRGDTLMVAIHNKTQKFANLPTVAPNGYFVEIDGDESSAFDNYYVQFKTNDPQTTFGQGTWVEIVHPDHKNRPSSATMPHALILTNGTFSFEPINWSYREAGDTESAPDPLFIGRRIEDLFLYRNRLGVLSDDNLTLSRAGELFSFYPETVTTITDADPISISAGHETVTNLKHAIPYQDSLVVFSDVVQFNLSGQETLSPQTTALKVATSFATNTDVRPVNSGNTLFFATPGGDYTGIREYYLDQDNTTKNAINITAHVPKYIPSKVHVLACSTNEDVLVIGNKTKPNTLHIYKYYWNGSEKLQAAWLEFKLGETDTIIDCAFLESTLYMLVSRGTEGTYLEKIDFSETNITPERPVTPHLDRLIKVSLSKDTATGKAIATFPYTITGLEQVINPQTLQGYGGSKHTATQLLLRFSYDQLKTPSNYIGGIPYTASYTFSEQFMRTGPQSGNLTMHQGRLQFRRWSLIYGYSGHFNVHVTHADQTTYTYTYTGRILGANTAPLGTAGIQKGTFNFPVKSISNRVAITLTNETHLPSSFLSVEWEANYTTRSRRI